MPRCVALLTGDRDVTAPNGRKMETGGGESPVGCCRMATANRRQGSRKMIGKRKIAASLCHLRGDDWRQISCEAAAMRRENSEKRLEDGSAAGGVP